MLSMGRVDMILIGCPCRTRGHGWLVNPFRLFLEDKTADVANLGPLSQRRRVAVAVGIDVRFHTVREAFPSFTVNLLSFGVSRDDGASEQKQRHANSQIMRTHTSVPFGGSELEVDNSCRGD